MHVKNVFEGAFILEMKPYKAGLFGFLIWGRVGSDDLSADVDNLLR